MAATALLTPTERTFLFIKAQDPQKPGNIDFVAMLYRLDDLRVITTSSDEHGHAKTALISLERLEATLTSWIALRTDADHSDAYAPLSRFFADQLPQDRALYVYLHRVPETQDEEYYCILGMCIVAFPDPARIPVRLGIEAFVIEPRVRRHGWGSSFFRAIRAVAVRTGFGVATGEVMLSATIASLPFWRRLGFAPATTEQLTAGASLPTGTQALIDALLSPEIDRGRTMILKIATSH
jgi:GNAT superfamily N-acetyltransferase